MTNTAFPPRAGRGLILTALITVLIAAGAVAPYEGGANHKVGADAAGPAGEATSAPARQGDWAVEGRWTGVYPNWDDPTPFEIPGLPVHLSVLPNGKLLYWGRDKGDDKNDLGDKCSTYLWDPLYPANSTVKLTEQTNLFCSGHSFLPDGKLFVAGGHVKGANARDEGIGETELNVFDYETERWTLLESRMSLGRWYPFNLTLDDGRTMIVAGSYKSDQEKRLNTTPDVLNLDGTLANPSPIANDGNTVNTEWKKNYPFIHLAPGGEVFYASALYGEARSRYLDRATNTWVRIPPLCANDLPFTGMSLLNAHTEGTSVMYAPGKVMVAGGEEYYKLSPCDQIQNFAPGKTNEVIDINNLSAPTKPKWERKNDMNYARRFFSSALLPDGKVFVVGGTQCEGGNVISSAQCANGAVMAPEIWDPANDVWTTMAPHQEVRVYHSTAALLPDARVLVAGGGLPAAAGETATGVDPFGNPIQVYCEGNNIVEYPCSHHAHRKIEIFSPPYLYEKNAQNQTVPARRPAVTSAPASAGYGEQFHVGVRDLSNLSTDVGGVVLVRLPSVTHGFNQDQRRVTLSYSVTADGKGLTVTAPADGRECPPGPYMLFVLRNAASGKKVPSVARIIRIGHFSITKDSATVLPAGATVSFNVKAPAGVVWHATPAAASWLSLSTQSAGPACSAPAGSVCGTGNGTVSVAVSANTAAGSRRREAKITLSVPGQRYTGHEFTVYQAAPVFSDAGADYATEPIYKLYARDLTAGCEDGTRYCPDANVTRGQMAVFIAKAMGITDPPSPPAPDKTFNDVTPDGPTAFIYRYVELLARLGITSGCGGGNYCPGDPINREQMSVFLLRALSIKDPIPPPAPTFNDVGPGHTYYKWIEELYRLGVTSGCGTGNYCPGQPVKRKDMAVFLVKAFGL